MKNGKLYREDARTAYYATEDGRILSFFPRGLQINHINCRRDDNRLENLELVSPRQNSLHPPTRRHCREAMRRKMKPVLDVTTGIRYESLSEAARRTTLDPRNISSCCRGRIRQTGGHVFRYAS